jgi:hypothetical protein
MNLTNKTAILASALKLHNVRPESEEGEDGGDSGTPVPAREFKLTKIMLTKKQIDQIVGKQAYNSFFNDGTKPPEPAFSSFSTLWLDDAYKDCAAKIEFGLSNHEIEIESGVKIKNISVKPKTGGVAEMSCTILGIFPRNVKTLDFENYLGKEIKVSLRFGSIDEGDEDGGKQEDLVDQIRTEETIEEGEEE